MSTAVLTAVVVLLRSSTASAQDVNDVLVQSKSVIVGSTGVTVGVYITNDYHISAMVLPLELRAITPGSYVTNSLTFSWTGSGRVRNSPLGPASPDGCDSDGDPSDCDWPAANLTFRRYPTPAGTNTCSGPVSLTYVTSAAAIDFVSPDAILWASVGQDPESPCLPPGTDGSPGSGIPSLQFVFDVTTTPGQFEIDTCCVDPANHLLFAMPPGGMTGCTGEGTANVIPTFTRGIITITITDIDGDGVHDPDDNCLGVFNPNQDDVDDDGLGDFCDNCPTGYNPQQEEGDGDQLGDVCDTLWIIARSPVDFVLISPDTTDSIGIAEDRSIFNTIGSDANYDTLTDFGTGPNGVVGERDDAIAVIGAVFGEWRIVIKPAPWADVEDEYFLGVRDPGGNFEGTRDPGGNIISNIAVTGSGLTAQFSVSDTVVTNAAPDPGEFVGGQLLTSSIRRGDITGDNVFDVLDVVGIVGIAFRAGSLPLISAIADVNCDGVASDVLDVVEEINYVFRGGDAPCP